MSQRRHRSTPTRILSRVMVSLDDRMKCDDEEKREVGGQEAEV